MLLATFAFIGGILSLQWFVALPSITILCLLPIFCLILWHQPTLRNIYIYLLLGLYWQYFHVTIHLQKSLPQTLESKSLIVQGDIAELTTLPDGSLKFLLTHIIMLAPESNKSYGDMQLYWYRYNNVILPRLKEGEKWQFTVRVKKPRHYANPGSFDYAKMLFFKRIIATGYIDNRAEPLLLTTENATPSIRRQIQTRIHYVLSGSEVAPLIAALGVGLRDTVTREQWDILSRTGTNHLLAISGLHVGLVSGLILFLFTHIIKFTPLIYYFPARWFAAWGVLLCIPFYGLLAGMSVPTQRAVIMVIIAMLFLLSRKPHQPWDGLALSALAIVIWDPFVVYAASFWLSFLAVAIIFMFANVDFSLGGFRQKFYCSIYMQWQISLGLVPITLLFFNTISWIGPLANFFAIPWVSFIVLPLILAAMCFDLMFPSLAVYVWQLAAWNLEALWFFLEKLAQFKWSSSMWIPNNFATWVGLIFAIMLLMLPRGIQGRWIALIVIFAICWQQPEKPQRGEVWASVLDVGQGLAVIVKTQNHILLFDAGGKSATNDSGKSVIIPFLRSQGWKKLDVLILSHRHADHTGGAKSILTEVAPEKILLGENINDVTGEFCEAGQTWNWDDVKFEILYPFARAREVATYSNDLSCVLKISSGINSLLIPADIEYPAEKALAEFMGNHLAATALVVPHHGSLTSSSEIFLKFVNPQYAFFATGYRNRFGFPKEAVVKRYHAQQTVLYDTAIDGAIQLRFDAKNFAIPISYRVQTARWWH